MLFNSLEFALFFVLVSTLYFALADRFRVPLLLLASCLFYMAFIPVYILIIFFTIGFDYCAGIYIEKSFGRKRKLILLSSIVINIGVLAVFKYFNFLSESLSLLLHGLGSAAVIPYLSILLPLGLSFHTFQAMSYTIEVYRGNQPAEKDLMKYALYVMFYPQMVAGPIERPQNLLPQLYEKHYFNYERVVDGLKLMAWGLFKKVVIADRLAVVVNSVYGDPQQHEGLTLLIATLFFSFQIYCDFSGYSDMALGAAQVMGFRLMQNFDRPYISSSIAEFWRRWHISLSNWFRDYLYIPLGGNRLGLSRWTFNIILVFILSGLWHGANVTFIIWGGLHALYYISYIIYKKIFPQLQLPRSFQIFLTFVCVSLSWVFFRAQNITEASYIVTHLFSGFNASTLYFFNACLAGSSISDALKTYDIVFSNLQWLTSFMLIAGMYLFQLLTGRERFFSALKARPAYLRWTFYYVFVALILLLGRFENKEFIYFQF